MDSPASFSQYHTLLRDLRRWYRASIEEIANACAIRTFENADELEPVGEEDGAHRAQQQLDAGVAAAVKQWLDGVTSGPSWGVVKWLLVVSAHLDDSREPPRMIDVPMFKRRLPFAPTIYARALQNALEDARDAAHQKLRELHEKEPDDDDDD